MPAPTTHPRTVELEAKLQVAASRDPYSYECAMLRHTLTARVIVRTDAAGRRVFWNGKRWVEWDGDAKVYEDGGHVAETLRFGKALGDYPDAHSEPAHLFPALSWEMPARVKKLYGITGKGK